MKKRLVFLLAAILLASSALAFSLDLPQTERVPTYEGGITSQRAVGAVPIVVAKDDPFYSIIATPVALYYEDGEQYVAPLLVQDFSSPSQAVVRFCEMAQIPGAVEIPFGSPLEVSISLAEMFWEQSDAALVIAPSPEGYRLAVAAAPLASYLNIPIFVADDIELIRDALMDLGVTEVFVCGTTGDYETVIRFNQVGEIYAYLLDVIHDLFGTVDYVTLANPGDVSTPTVLDSVTYSFKGDLPSVPTLPAQSFNVLLASLRGEDIVKQHAFEVPYGEYARIKLDLANLKPENAHELGDRIFLMIMNATGVIYAYTATGAGPGDYIDGDLVQDHVHYEFIVCQEPGNYTAQVIGQWFADTVGEYELTITVEQLNTPIDPLMDNLSSLAGYLTAYHRGLVFVGSDWAFAYPGGGVSQPSDNPHAIIPCNNHVKRLHSQLNALLALIADVPHEPYDLQQHYSRHPINVAILADPTMIPMYYYKNPDDGYLMGWGVPGDFIYGDVDPKPLDMENDTFTYYPFQENAVGRITGYDAEDCSALIARTIFYHDLLDVMGNWKQNATIQTGCGLEFQWIPLLTTLSNRLFGGTDPTKWPTGESYFINLRLSNDLEKNGFVVKRTHLLSSQQEGFEDLHQYGRRYFLFPRFYEAISGDNVKGGISQEQSSIIFAFNHGFYYLYESGDILLDARGFPPFTTISRFYPMGSGLSSKGTFDVRSVSHMEFGPSVVYIESCICGRTDGLQPENCLSQAYIHAGVNAFIAASRVTADPGYLEPGKIVEGFGIWGFINATLNLKLRGSYPQPHFGAVIAEDFILDMVVSDNTTGIALRNAKNQYLAKDANTTFLWTPPLISTGCTLIDNMLYETLDPPYSYGQYLDKKYHCLHEFNLYGDPAFNPYQPI